MNAFYLIAVIRRDWPNILLGLFLAIPLLFLISAFLLVLGDSPTIYEV